MSIHEGEIWKEVDGYRVSDLGRLWGSRIGPFVPMSMTSGGYIFVIRGGSRVTLHSLVCRAFHGEPLTADQTVDHKDRNRTNNRADNLEWVSPSKQCLNRIPGHQLRRADYTAIEANFGSGWVRFASVSTCAKENNLNSRGISKCLTGVLKSHKGGRYRWVLTNPNEGEEFKYLEEHGLWISNHGRSKNKNGRIFAPVPQDCGYCRVKGHFVHKLVMIAFGPVKPAWAKSVDHIDRNKSNNHIDNLRWSCPLDQAQNRQRPHINVDNHCKKIKMVDANGNVRTFDSAKEASEMTGTSRSTISECANGKRKATGNGTIWMFE